MVSDAADGDDRVSGQQKVFSHLLTQSHRAKSVQIAEDHLPLRPIGRSETHTHAHRHLSNSGGMLGNESVIYSLLYDQAENQRPQLERA